MNSPERFDLTYKFWKVGSMHADAPMILEIVAVGAIAMQFELRMPCSLMRERNVSQSSELESSTSTLPPRSSRSIASVSCGRMPRDHSEPSYDW
ncbi:Uncharacterised protein [Bordetella pertussis]|nr:Uncharacterised protein [Bordetella pertussis]CFO64533.1 Uncharacterised protein [Bordetella pertussis]CFU79044.1 Uncharacterised protein [Bordetella pertussis]CPH62904.1 Uncharacterised protein [Bordetella pertussis]CPK58316.1 Uncharacterised protein [Bordetella pertussis]